MLLHGYGSNEHELFARVNPLIGADVVQASLRGPVVEGGGFAWVSLETSLTTLSADAIAAVARDRAQNVLDWLTSLPPFRSVGLLGVSQGAVLALHMLRMTPTRFAYAVNLSGYVLAGEEIGDAVLRQERPPVFWGRGENDAVIPASYVRRTEEWLPQHSTPTIRVYQSGHEESPAKIADAGTFVAGLTRGQVP